MALSSKANCDAATPPPTFHRKSAATLCREPQCVRSDLTSHKLFAARPPLRGSGHPRRTLTSPILPQGGHWLPWSRWKAALLRIRRHIRFSVQARVSSLPLWSSSGQKPYFASDHFNRGAQPEETRYERAVPTAYSYCHIIDAFA